MSDLYRRSIEIILANQAPSGAYIASPNFATYRYCWFRDGSYIAYAMDLTANRDSAARFHAWAAGTVNARRQVVSRALDKAQRGLPLADEDILHTRYTLDGQDGRQEEWPNFQLDGFGTWLWALEQHARLAGQILPGEWLQAAGLVAQYLSALWRLPCFDCWEEFPDQVHTSTLASIYGGLAAYARLSGNEPPIELEAIGRFLEEQACTDGRYVKAAGRKDVDASLLALSTPYRVVAPDDPAMRATVAAIERDLRRGGGVHRYSGDTYYGGGEWVLLTAWLGWYYAEAGQTAQARELLAWVEAQADAEGNLPEQVPASLNDPAAYRPWLERWGEIARPLLWSNAKYLILKSVLNPT